MLSLDFGMVASTKVVSCEIGHHVGSKRSCSFFESGLSRLAEEFSFADILLRPHIIQYRNLNIYCIALKNIKSAQGVTGA